MKKSIVFFLALTFAASALWAGASIDRFTASASGDRIVVRWRATSETQMQKYEIYRKSRTTDYTLVYTQLPSGSGTQYEYVDMVASNFRSGGGNTIAAENYTYLLKIIAADGTSQLETSIAYQASTSKRTWGSIKAIFR